MWGPGIAPTIVGRSACARCGTKVETPNRSTCPDGAIYVVFDRIKNNWWQTPSRRCQLGFSPAAGFDENHSYKCSTLRLPTYIRLPSGFPQASLRLPSGFPQTSHRLPTGFPQASRRVQRGTGGWVIADCTYVFQPVGNASLFISGGDAGTYLGGS